MNARWTFALLLLAAVGPLGCGGSRPPETNSGARRSGGHDRSVPAYVSTHGSHGSSSHAAKVRAATAKRRGSWNLSSEKVEAVASFVAENAEKYDLSEDLLFGIIWVESRFDPRAVSPVGARGLMQLMPSTAKYLAECIGWDGRKNSFDPTFNIAAGAYYIARLIREFDGNEDLALAAYNAGPAKVRRWLAGDGLPKVSVEYASMVQTARTFFRRGDAVPALPTPAAASARVDAVAKTTPAPSRPERPSTASSPVITDDGLDRLGLAILIAGFHDDAFRTAKQDVENPFN